VSAPQTVEIALENMNSCHTHERSLVYKALAPAITTRRSLSLPAGSNDLFLFLNDVCNNLDVIFAQREGDFFHHLAAQAIELAGG
jgi:hypothetical protein